MLALIPFHVSRKAVGVYILACVKYVDAAVSIIHQFNRTKNRGEIDALLEIRKMMFDKAAEPHLFWTLVAPKVIVF